MIDDPSTIPQWQVIGAAVVGWLSSLILVWRQGGKTERKRMAEGGSLDPADDRGNANITKDEWKARTAQIDSHERALFQIKTHELPTLIDDIAEQATELEAMVRTYANDKTTLLRLEERFGEAIQQQRERDIRMEKQRSEDLERMRLERGEILERLKVIDANVARLERRGTPRD